jgi:hypothetical protein
LRALTGGNIVDGVLAYGANAARSTNNALKQIWDGNGRYDG